MDGHTDRQMNKHTDKQLDRWMDRQTERQTAGQIQNTLDPDSFKWNTGSRIVVTYDIRSKARQRKRVWYNYGLASEAGST